MNRTLWIFVLNSYPTNKSSAGFLKRIQDQIDSLPSLITECKMVAHWELINLTKEDLYSKFSEMVKEPEYKNAKQLIFIFRGHGEELIESAAPGIISLDGQTIFFHRLMKHFFKGIDKDIYMIADMCRAPIEDVPLVTKDALTTNRGYFVLAHGVARSESGYGIFAKYVFQKFKLICHNPDLKGILLFIQIIILSARYDDNTLNSKIYVNESVRNEYPKIVSSIQEITNQDNMSIRATKIGLSSECSSLMYEISTHKHEPITCAVAIKRFINKCRYHVEDESKLKPCTDTCIIGIANYDDKIKTIRGTNFVEIDQSKNTFRSFSYWNDLGTYVSALLLLAKVLMDYQIKPTPKLKVIYDKYSPLQIQINDKLIPLSKKIEEDYQKLDFESMVKLLNEMKSNPIINKNESTAIGNLIVEYSGLNLLRKSGDIFNSIRDFNYFYFIQYKLKSLDNKLIDLLAKLEDLYKPYRKIYVDSDRKDVSSLKKIIEYYDTLNKQKKLTENERGVVSDLLQQYIKRLSP